MKDPKKISGNDVKNICDSLYKSKDKQIQWHGKTLIIKTILSLDDIVRLIREILDICVKKDGNYFVPEMVDFAFRSAVIENYSQVELPSDIEERYFVVYAADLFNAIISVANMDQINSIKKILKHYTHIDI